MTVVLLAVLVSQRSGMMQVKGAHAPSPTPISASFDRNVVTREVCLPEEAWYTIQTGVFSQREAAQEKAAAYADRGAPGTVVEDGGKWRVFIASYGSEADASAVRQRLGEMQRVETYLYPWKCPELRLRLTGMAGQLDVAEAGLTLFGSAAALLRDTATQLDAAQLTAEEAARVIDDLSGQISLWAETTRDRFGRNAPELVQQLLLRADAWVDRAAALKAASSSAQELSAALKGQGMQMYDEEILLRRALNGS